MISVPSCDPNMKMGLCEQFFQSFGNTPSSRISLTISVSTRPMYGSVLFTIRPDIWSGPVLLPKSIDFYSLCNLPNLEIV